MSGVLGKLVNSAGLNVAAKLLHSGIGLISLLILARLLSPQDFAVTAITAMVIYFFDVLSSLGSEQYLIQKKRLTRPDLNTAWTLDLLIKTLLWLLLLLASPWVEGFYSIDNLAMALCVAASVLPINALKNPGVYRLKRHLHYRGIFWLSVLQRLISFTVVLLIASIYRNYWALIIADVCASLVFTLGSYHLSRHKPVLSLRHLGEQWQFSRWMICKGILGYCRAQVDTFFVSLTAIPAKLGQFHVARNLAMLPAQNILQPMLDPLLAVYKDNRQQPERMAAQLNLSLAFTALLVIPGCGFLYAFADVLIQVLLGNKWQEATPILQACSLLTFYFPFLLIFEHVLLATDKVKTAFWYDILSLTVITLGLVLLMPQGILAIAWSRGALGLLTTLALAVYVQRHYAFVSWPLLQWMISRIVFTLLAVQATQILLANNTLAPLFGLLGALICYFGIFIALCWLEYLLFGHQAGYFYQRLRQYIATAQHAKYGNNKSIPPSASESSGQSKD